MHVNFALLCDYALVSADGKISALGLFARIYATQFPATHPQSFLVFEIELDYTELGHPVSIRLECVDADGVKLLEARTTVMTEGPGRIGDRPMIPQIVKLPPLHFKQPGKHDLNVFLGSDSMPKQRASFEVILLTPPTDSAPSAPVLPPTV